MFRKNKNMYLFLVLVIFISVMLSSCAATSVKEQAIDSINIYLLNISSNREVTNLIPGRYYKVKAVVITTNGEKIEDPNYKEFGFNSPNNTFTDFKWQNQWNMFVKATSKSFDLADGRKFKLSLKVENNPYQNSYEWGVDWNNYDYFDFSGADGKDGRDGR
ncbi:MAG: hypothetical protein ACOCV8_04925, partial [Spirochaetota bacterium]